MNLRMLARIQSKLARSLISLDDRARHEPMLRSVLEDAVSNGPEMAAVAMGGKTREVEIFTALHPLMTRHRINSASTSAVIPGSSAPGSTAISASAEPASRSSRSAAFTRR